MPGFLMLRDCRQINLQTDAVVSRGRKFVKLNSWLMRAFSFKRLKNATVVQALQINGELFCLYCHCELD
jgi:hypothetical protein